MDRYGTDLKGYLKKFGNNLSLSSVFNIGIKILKFLKTMHNSSFVYGNLMPSNILIGRKTLEELKNLHEANDDRS